MAYNEDSSASGQDEPWIQWFCGLRGHEMFCEVERSYIEDGFNLYGLRACVQNFSDCLDLILDRIGPDDSDDSHLTQSACTLYGLIHARYIITAHGLDAMYNKYAAKEFGTCPLIQCGCQPVLPVGLRDEMGTDTVKVFCPKCQNIFHPPPIRIRSSQAIPTSSSGSSGVVDGAAFGTTFPHLFLMTFNNLVPDGLSPDSTYVPRVFGFRVHHSARQRSGSTNNTSIEAAAGSAALTTTSGKKGGHAIADGGGADTNAIANDSHPQDHNQIEDNTAAIAADSNHTHSLKTNGMGKDLKKASSDIIKSEDGNKRKGKNDGKTTGLAENGKTKRQKKS